MGTLSADLRNKLERTSVAARNLGERAARAALEALAVHRDRSYDHMSPGQRKLRGALAARAKQIGDERDAKGNSNLDHLVQECAYEHWHRMLFARFLAENGLLMLIEPGEQPAAVSLDDCKELAEQEKQRLRREARTPEERAQVERLDQWAIAGRYAQIMLPEIFRVDDPVLRVSLAKEDQIDLEELLDGLPAVAFTASDSLGWCYQFWQTERKDQVNVSGDKVGADELPSVTQLFTEDYMVDFLLDNTLGAWWAGKLIQKAEGREQRSKWDACKTEEDCRRLAALPGCPWKYLRFVKGKDGRWTPAAGTFEGWPKTAKELKCLDPCCGSGHFIVAMFGRLVALRMAEEKADEKAAVAAVISDNLFGLELDARCTQISAFSVALAAWGRVGHCGLPPMHIACSGLAPNTREADWLKLGGGSDKLQRGMARLYRLFQHAPVLGSLINPRASGGDLLEAGFQELRPLLAKALAQEAADETTHEMAVTAQGITKAAEILSGQFTLAATNVPYVGRGKQGDVLMDYCERVHPDAKADLATCFVERCLDFCALGGSVAVVTPQNWLFLGTYRKLRQKLLSEVGWESVVRLGEHAFESPQAAGAFVALTILTRRPAVRGASFYGLDASGDSEPGEKAVRLLADSGAMFDQGDQLGQPDCRIVFGDLNSEIPQLSAIAECYQGVRTGDRERFIVSFWEVGDFGRCWEPFRNSSDSDEPHSGLSEAIKWEGGKGQLHEYAAETREKLHDMHESGNRSWGRLGVAINQMRQLAAYHYLGERYDGNVNVIVPFNATHLPAIWCYCSSPDYALAVRKLDQKLNVTNATLIKVPFDLGHWQRLAAERYPHGLPKPFSSDPTQWLFNGHPKGADQPLQVAVARLLGYQWPRQSGSSFPDCPALGQDGLEKLADDDGIVCIPPVRGEEPAAERLRKLLAAAYGGDWKGGKELEFIRATGSNAGDLEEWLRNDFFEQHCDLFHQRPFIWHVWDGRKRDGFHALVNYHRLAAGDSGRRTLENLTHSYLGDWITRQKDSLKRGEEGAEERLAAAVALKERLEAILAGEPPFDLFVRWKAQACQPIGWEPDVNDGVRMNIRPFMASDLPNGKKGAGVLRVKPNIKWEKDRGKEPRRAKEEYPWFWNGNEFTGERVNGVHLTIEEKRKARG